MAVTFENCVFRFGSYELDPRGFELRWRGERVQVQPRVLEVLMYLVQNHDRLVTKEELLQGPWRGMPVRDDALYRAVLHAREALSAEGGQNPIRTVRGKGFRFVLPVERVSRHGRAGLPASGVFTRRSADDHPGADESQRADEHDAAMRPVSTAPFVGRRSELSELTAAAERARAGQGGLLLVGGESGIGKSRLVRHFAESAERERVDVLWGHCSEASGAPAFWPWIEITRAHLRSYPPPEGCPESDASDVVRLSPELGRHLGMDPGPPKGTGSSGPELRFRLFDSLARYLLRAAERPLILIVEDLHVADESSLLFLDFLRQRIGRSQLLVIGTFRPHEARARSRLADLTHLAGCETRTVELEGLDPASLGELVVQLRGRAASPSALARLYHRSAGNVFFALELIRASRDVDAESTAEEFSELPERIAGALHGRFLRLPSETHALLQTAAVIGVAFDATLAQKVHGMDPSALVTLEPALADDLIQPVPAHQGAFRFVHALVRDALYLELSLSSRLALHAKVGAQLEERVAIAPETVFDVAYHYRLAAPQAGADKAIEYGLMAAERATATLAYEVAAEHYRAVLATMDPSHGAAVSDVNVRLGSTLEAAGQREAALAALQTAAEVARTTNAPDAFARAVLTRFTVQREVAALDEFVRRGLAQALGQFQEDSPTRARLLAAQGYADLFRAPPTRRLELFDRALTLARRLHDPETLAWVLLFRCWSNLELPSPEHRAHCDEMIAAAEAADDHETLKAGRLFRGYLHLALGEADAFEVDLDEYDRTAESYQLPSELWCSAMNRCARSTLRGELERAETLCREAYQGAVEHQGVLADAFYGAQLLGIALQQQGPARTRIMAELKQQGERMLALVPAFRVWAVPVFYAAVETGPRANAKEELASLTAEALEGRFGLPHRVKALALLSEAAVALGDLQQADIIYSNLLPAAGQGTYQLFSYLGQVNHYLALLARALGDHDAAERHWTAAHQEFTRVRAWRWLANSRKDAALQPRLRSAVARDVRA